MHLAHCIDSILIQTHGNLEILLVNDGSTDGCGAICTAYAAQDARVRVLQQENAGVSAARNAGIAAAHGKYITFVDADDTVAPDIIAHLYETLTKHQAQISVCGILFVDEAGRTLPPYPKAEEHPLLTEQALAAMFYQTLFYTSPCAKLYETDIVRAYAFPVGKRYEDLATVYRWVAKADTIAINTKPLYRYLQHTRSFMGLPFSEVRFAELDVADEICSFTHEHFPTILNAAKARRFAVCCQVLLQMPADRRQYLKQRERILRTMHADVVGVRRDRSCRRKDRLAAWLFTVTGESGLRLIWRLCR